MVDVGWITEDGAHPRVSGENRGLADKGVDVAGSSPRERGKLTNSELAY